MIDELPRNLRGKVLELLSHSEACTLERTSPNLRSESIGNELGTWDVFIRKYFAEDLVAVQVHNVPSAMTRDAFAFLALGKKAGAAQKCARTALLASMKPLGKRLGLAPESCVRHFTPPPRPVLMINHDLWMSSEGF